MGVDQGTTGTACVAYDEELRAVAEAYRELPNRYPHPGRVEQDPEDVVRTVVETVGEVLEKIGARRTSRSSDSTTRVRPSWPGTPRPGAPWDRPWSGPTAAGPR